MVFVLYSLNIKYYGTSTLFSEYKVLWYLYPILQAVQTCFTALPATISQRTVTLAYL
jgi:hypothetical protein